MKFKSLYSLGIAAFLPFFLPNFFTGKVNPAPAPALNCEQYISAVRVEQDMLVFADWNHYNQVLTCLTQRYDAYHDSLNTVYAGLTDEQYSDLEDRIGIDDDKPLKDFEARLKFNSLRAVIESRIVTWLLNDRLDLNNDPDDEPIMDEVERTLLNPNYLVKIGREVVNMNDEATEGGEGGTASRGEACEKKGKMKQWFYYMLEEAGKMKEYRYKVKIKFNDVSNGAKTKAKVVHYKRKNGGGWKRYKTKMTLRYDILLRDSGCARPTPFNKSKGPEKKKKLVITATHTPGFAGRVKPFVNEYCGKATIHDAGQNGTTCF